MSRVSVILLKLVPCPLPSCFDLRNTLHYIYQFIVKDKTQRWQRSPGKVWREGSTELPHPFLESRPSSTNPGTLGTQSHWKSGKVFIQLTPSSSSPPWRSVVPSLSHIWLFVSPWTAAHQAPCPSLSPEVCSNSYPLSQWCHPAVSSSVIPLLLLPSIFLSIRVFSDESALCIRWPKYWSFSFSISPSSEYSGLISFRIDWFDLLAVQGTFKSLLQHHIQKHQSFNIQSSLWSSPHICIWLL